MSLHIGGTTDSCKNRKIGQSSGNIQDTFYIKNNNNEKTVKVFNTSKRLRQPVSPNCLYTENTH